MTPGDASERPAEAMTPGDASGRPAEAPTPGTGEGRLGFEPVADVARLERVAAAAVPCLERVHDDGWQLRFNMGETRRCSSVLPMAEGRDPVDLKIDRAEAFYRRHAAMPRFQLSPASRPLGLLQRLTERGYRLTPGAVVMTALLERVMATLGPGAPAEGARAPVTIARVPTEAWLDTLREATGKPEASASVLRLSLGHVLEPAAFLTLHAEGRPVAVALAVLLRDLVGLFNVATVPGFRRRGAAVALMRSAARWATGEGGRGAYLQVHPANEGARALYRRCGFEDHHTYEYAELP